MMVSSKAKSSPSVTFQNTQSALDVAAPLSTWVFVGTVPAVGIDAQSAKSLSNVIWATPGMATHASARVISPFAKTFILRRYALRG